jgi:hypothetical protein
MKFNYEEDMNIEDDALDLAYLDQSRLAMKYGRHLADCRKRKTICEENVKLIRSELINKANRKPMKYLKIPKSTAVSLEAFYRTDQRHIDAKEDLFDAEYELELAQIAFNEISRTKKTSIEGLTKLLGMQYFAAPSLPRDLQLERRNRETTRKAANKKVKIKKRRKVKRRRVEE